jgi:hypothetical protein
MKLAKARSLIFFILLFAVAALALDASYAQGRGSGGQQKQQMPQGQKDQGQGQMQKGMHQESHMSQQQKLMRQQMPDQAMYGHQMMTAEERERYRQQLNSAQSDREWSRIRRAHDDRRGTEPLYAKDAGRDRRSREGPYPRGTPAKHDEAGRRTRNRRDAPGTVITGRHGPEGPSGPFF